jgi:hypothetical protein
VASLANKIAWASRVQLVFLSVTWLAGINVNGFVPILPGTGAGMILSNSSVAIHVVLGALTAATGVFILALAWADGSIRTFSYSVLAAVAIVVAGYSGISFVLGGGSSTEASMVMATAFIVALFLTFLALVSVRSESDGSPRPEAIGPYSVSLGAVALTLFFLVFVSGMYVNLYVAGPVYSLPLAKEAAAFSQAEGTAGFVAHEALGGLLLLTLLAFAVSLRRSRSLALVAVIPVALVAYSAYVGSVNLDSHLPVVGVGQATELLSSLGLMVGLVVTMLLVAKARSDRSPWHRQP